MLVVSIITELSMLMLDSLSKMKKDIPMPYVDIDAAHHQHHSQQDCPESDFCCSVQLLQ